MLKDNKLLITVILLLTGYTMSWFQSSMQFFWDWWKDRQLLASVLLSIPCGIVFIYATKYGYESTGSLWSARFLGFGISYLVFPLLTWVFMKETPFTWKTLTCILLSLIILLIQVYGSSAK